MKRTFAVAAALALVPMAGAVAQSHDLWVGAKAVDASRIWAGTHVITTSVLENGERTPGFTQTEEVAFVSWDDKRYLRQTVVVERDGEVRATDTTFYDAETLAPVRHASYSPEWRTLTLSYWGDKVAGRQTRNGREPEDIEVTLNPKAYDPSSYLLLVRALPLEAGYGARIPIFNHERLENSWMSVWVTGVERTQVGRDEYEDAFLVSVSYEGSDASSKYWITKDSRLLIKSEASWREGQTVTGWARFTPANTETDRP